MSLRRSGLSLSVVAPLSLKYFGCFALRTGIFPKMLSVFNILCDFKLPAAVAARHFQNTPFHRCSPALYLNPFAHFRSNINFFGRRGSGEGRGRIPRLAEKRQPPHRQEVMQGHLPESPAPLSFCWAAGKAGWAACRSSAFAKASSSALRASADKTADKSVDQILDVETEVVVEPGHRDALALDRGIPGIPSRLVLGLVGRRLRAAQHKNPRDVAFHI